MKAYLVALLASSAVCSTYHTNDSIKDLCMYGSIDCLLPLLNTRDAVAKNGCLVDACHGGNYQVVFNLLLDEDVEHDIAGYYGLIEAIKEGEVDVVRLLINDPRIDWVSIASYEPIQVAILKRQEKILDILLKHKRAVKALDESTRNILRSSITNLSKKEKKERLHSNLTKHCGSGNVHTVRMKLMGKRSGTAQKCLEIAFENSNTDVFAYLLTRRDVDPTVGNSWYLYKSAKDGDLEMVEALVKTGNFDMVKQGGQALAVACEKNRAGVASYLLKAGVDPSYKNNLPLRLACRHNCPTIVFALIEKGADPSANENEAIQIASAAGAYSIVNYLLIFESVDPSANHNSALRWAAFNGHAQVVDLLMSDPRVDPSDNDNEAIRRVVARPHSMKILPKLLADKRVDPSCRNNYPIKTSIKKGYKEAVGLLASDPRVVAKLTSEELELVLGSM